MTNHSDLDFPSDRSLLSSAASRSSISITHHIDAAGVTKQKVGFATLFIFSRLLQREHLQVCLQDVEAASYLNVEIDPEKTLHEALGLCRLAALSSIGRIGLMIITTSDPNGQIVLDEPVLSFAASEKETIFSINFDPSLLSPISAKDFLEKLFMVIDALAAAPQTRCADLELVTPTARTLIPDLSHPIVVDHFPTVIATFFQVAGMYPAEPAITDGTQSYTYAELARMVRYLTLRLIDAGLVQGDIVAISGLASFGVYASMLAVMAAGGVLVTIDQSLPVARRDLIERICRPRLRIEVARPDITMARKSAIVTPDWPTSAELAAVPDKARCVVELAADAPAYVFFTSGSSGVPKGVLGAHLGLAHFLAWQRTSFPIGPGDRMAQLIALSFDPVLRDVLYPLTSGACLHVPAREMLFNARRMVAWFETQAITVMHCVPSLMKAWLQVTPPGHPFATMRYAFFNGEPLTDFLLRRFMAAAGPDTRMINLYGPTETTLAKVSRTIDRIEPGVQPIGTPQAGVDVAIIRNRVTRCGLWEIGEIAIRTPYRSKGYLDNPDLTAQAFVVNPLGNDPRDLIYFTGDLGRVRSDGLVEIFGRNDAQFKIHGVRIEPNEIESAMLGLPGVADAAVMLREGANDEKLLVGLVVLKDAPSDAERTGVTLRIRDALRSRLSYAMVPSRIVLCEALPYLPNGKLDRKALAALEIDLPMAKAVPAHHSRTDDERLRRLVTGLEETLGIRIDSLNSSFLDLGGDSISYIRASMFIEDLLGWLPREWEKKPLAEFPTFWQGRDLPPQSDVRLWGVPLVGMEVPLLLRALSIVLVVLSHSSITEVVTATSTLFVISGMNFSRFLRPAIRTAGSVWPTVKLILKFAIPAGLWQVPRSVWMDSWWLPNLFLLGTFYQNPDRPLMTPWFLDVLAANLMLLALIGWIGYRVGAGRRSCGERKPNSFKGDFAWVLVGLVAAAIQVTSGWWDGEVGTESVAPFKWFWMLALGVLITQADSTARKAMVSALLLMLAVAAYSGEWTEAMLHRIDAFFFLSVALLIWVERVRVPRRLHRPIMVVASATLFIYLVNYTAIMHVMPKMHLPPWWPLEVCVAVVSGIVAKLIWDFVSSQTMHWAVRLQGMLRRL